MIELNKEKLEKEKAELENRLIELEENVEFMKDHIHTGYYETEDILKIQGWMDEIENSIADVEVMLKESTDVEGGEYDA